MGSVAVSRDSVRIESNCGTPVFFFFFFSLFLFLAAPVLCSSVWVFSTCIRRGYSSLWTSLVAQKVKHLATM